MRTFPQQLLRFTTKKKSEAKTHDSPASDGSVQSDGKKTLCCEAERSCPSFHKQLFEMMNSPPRSCQFTRDVWCFLFVIVRPLPYNVKRIEMSAVAIWCYINKDNWIELFLLTTQSVLNYKSHLIFILCTSHYFTCLTSTVNLEPPITPSMHVFGLWDEVNTDTGRTCRLQSWGSNREPAYLLVT